MILLALAGVSTIGFTVFLGLFAVAGLGSNWGAPKLEPEAIILLGLMIAIGLAMVWRSLKYYQQRVGCPTDWRFLGAIFLPALVFFVAKRPFIGILCTFLQLSFLAWIPTTIWTIYWLGKKSSSDTDQKKDCLEDWRFTSALLLPALTLFAIKRPLSGLICIFLQWFMVGGWLLATSWAIYMLEKHGYGNEQPDWVVKMNYWKQKFAKSISD